MRIRIQRFDDQKGYRTVKKSFWKKLKSNSFIPRSPWRMFKLQEKPPSPQKRTSPALHNKTRLHFFPFCGLGHCYPPGSGSVANQKQMRIRVHNTGTNTEKMRSEPDLIVSCILRVKYAAEHRLNIELGLQSLFELHVTWCAQLFSLAETPQLPLPPHLGS